MFSYSDPVAVSSEQLAEYLELGLEIAAEAGREILPVLSHGTFHSQQTDRWAF